MNSIYHISQWLSTRTITVPKKINPCFDIDPENDSWDPGRDQTNHIILLLFRPDFDPD